MTSPSKNKGNSFELDIAKYLSTTYGENFLRVPSSGAFIGGKNQHRKENMHESQIRNFKGDIIPGESFTRFNAECKSYGSFAFHLILKGEHKQLDGWLDQLMAVAEKDDCSILFMKFNRIGKYVAVQANKTWVTDQFIYYSSPKVGDWILIEFDHFFKNNKALFQAYSSTPGTSPQSSTPNITLSSTAPTANIITLNT